MPVVNKADDAPMDAFVSGDDWAVVNKASGYSLAVCLSPLGPNSATAYSPETSGAVEDGSRRGRNSDCHRPSTRGATLDLLGGTTAMV